VSEEGLIEIAERMLAVEKAMNVLAGIERKDAMPPDRLYEPIPGGRSKGMALDREETRRMLKRPSAQHGWDAESGAPTGETLLRLGLEEVAGRLETAGRL